MTTDKFDAAAMAWEPEYEPPLHVVAHWRVREAFGDDFVNTEKGHNMVKDMTNALKDGFLVRLQRVHGFKELLVYSE